VNIGKAKAVNFGYVKVILKISKAAVERGDLYTMPTLLEVPDDFAGAGGVSGPLTVYAVEDVCHRSCNLDSRSIKARRIGMK
jgi:hypothetical protein